MECVDRLKVVMGETSTAISVTGGLEMAKQNYGLGEGWLDSDALAPLFVEE